MTPRNSISWHNVLYAAANRVISFDSKYNLAYSLFEAFIALTQKQVKKPFENEIGILVKMYGRKTICH
jgi:hypothetical protein